MGRPFHDIIYAGTGALAKRVGEANKQAKLDTSQVIEIRRLYDEGGRGNEHSKAFEVSANAFNAIGRRIRWKHI